MFRFFSNSTCYVIVFLKEYEISAHIPLLVGGIFTAGIAIFKLGFTWKELEEGILSTINTTMPSILILLIVGVLIGTGCMIPISMILSKTLNIDISQVNKNSKSSTVVGFKED